MTYPNYEKVQEELDKLHQANLSLILSTQNTRGELETSYSPYVFHNDCYYVLISELAPHTSNILAHPAISLLIIDDENRTKNIYARNRVSYRAVAAPVEKDSLEYQQVIKQLTERAGKTVDLLTSINDFHLFCLTPHQGRLIIGFGLAYLLDAQTHEAIHVDKDVLQRKN